MDIISRAKLMYSRQGAAGICRVYDNASTVEQAEANLYRMKFATHSSLSRVKRFQQAVMQDIRNSE